MTEKKEKVILHLDLDEANTVVSALGSTPAYYNSLIERGVISSYLLGGDLVENVKNSCQSIITKISSQAQQQTELKKSILEGGNLEKEAQEEKELK